MSDSVLGKRQKPEELRDDEDLASAPKARKLEVSEISCIAKSIRPASQFYLLAKDGRARRGTLVLPHSTVQTPCFMPVGTYGTIKMVSAQRMAALGPQLILSNTFFMAKLEKYDYLGNKGRLHKFMNWPRSLLTDSGGYQMVSLCKLSKITEEGVDFVYPGTEERNFLTPERSIQLQMHIGSDVMMALDDVISVVTPDRARFEESTERTTRWLDRCISAHTNTDRQNLWGIVQGGIYQDLRAKSMKDLIERDLPGYAIGGLSGGEAKDDFWKSVEMCAKPDGLPENKSRYLMGVGYPVDLVVCVALGVDLFDCVYPTRTARFGTVFTDDGLLKLKQKKYENDYSPIDPNCDCDCCMYFTRAFLHKAATKQGSAMAMMTEHNIRYMHNLGARMRAAIEQNRFVDFVKDFIVKQFSQNDQPVKPPKWVKDALIHGAEFDETNVNEWFGPNGWEESTSCPNPAA